MIPIKRKTSIYWLGGSTCAGKTTVSNVLSEKYNLKVYHCDEYLGKHIEKSNAQDHPNLCRAKNINWDDILNMPVTEYLNWIIGLFKEEYDMILQDLNELYDDQPILVEGTGLLPEIIDSDIEFNNAIWLVARKDFYEKHQCNRKEFFERIMLCANPELALENYMSFDLAMGRHILNSAKNLGLKVIEVENENDYIKYIDDISTHFRLIQV